LTTVLNSLYRLHAQKGSFQGGRTIQIMANGMFTVHILIPELSLNILRNFSFRFFKHVTGLGIM